MPTRRLPPRPDLDHLKHQARDLQRDHASGELGALQRLREFHPRFAGLSDARIRAAELTRSDALLAIAREYGFRSWARLRDQVASGEPADLERPHHLRIGDPTLRRAVALLDDGDAGALRVHLEAHPDLVSEHTTFEGGNYFQNPTLLEFAAENPIRHGTLPPNIVEVAKVVLEAGASPESIDATLGLVCSGKVPRECGVQVPLIELLCDHGADPAKAVLAALGHGEFEAVEALIRRGAPIDLPTAAALGRTGDARRALPEASSEERHRGLALAAQFGKVELLELLLEAGEDPNRYNPVGLHAHSTPLHQAALAGHIAVVRALVESGARLDVEDILFQGTPLGWARHGGQDEVADYLRSRGAAVSSN